MKKTISFVFPMYNESGNVAPLYKELVKISKKLTKYNLEYIFVNDFSKDNTLTLLQLLAKKDKRVKVLSFSRNYGHQLAVTAGQDQAKGQIEGEPIGRDLPQQQRAARR